MDTTFASTHKADLANSISQDFPEDEEAGEFAVLKRKLSYQSLDEEACKVAVLKRQLSHPSVRSKDGKDLPALKKARSELDVKVAAIAEVKPTSELADAVSQDLAGHTTQGAHGMNYHHNSPGDEGTTFFMPMKSLLGEGALGAVQQIKALGSWSGLVADPHMIAQKRLLSRPQMAETFVRWRASTKAPSP